MAKKDAGEGRNGKSDTENWVDLASHFKDKVLKRTSEVTLIHTKAGFLIAAAVIVLQEAVGLPQFADSLMVFGVAVAGVLAITALIFAIISMNFGNSASPLNPDDVILQLTERPNMSRKDFANWMAKSYAKTNTEFNKSYNKKYKQQIIAASLLVASFVIIITLKGINVYV